MGKRKLKKSLALASLLTFSFGLTTLTGCQQQQTIDLSSVTLSSNVSDIEKFLDIKLFEVSGTTEEEIPFGTNLEVGTEVKVYFNILPEQYENCVVNSVKLNSKYITTTSTGCSFRVVQGKNELFIELDVLRLISIDKNGDKDADVFACDEKGEEVIKAKPGTKLYVSISDNKKQVKEVRINDVAIVKGVDGRYGFTMPDSDVLITIIWGENINLTHSIRINTNGETIAKGAIKVTNSNGEEVTTGIAGETISVTVNHTKYVSELKVNDVPVKESETSGVFVFGMPEENVLIDISWVETTSISLTYTDSAFDSVKLINADTKQEVSISSKKASIDVGEDYALILDVADNFAVESVSLNGTELSYDEAIRGYNFVALKDSLSLSITTSEIKLPHSIIFNANSTEITAENVSFYVNDAPVNSAKEGEVVTVKFVKGETYVISGAYFNGKPATKVSDTEWTFTMPDEDVTVTAITETTKGVASVINSSNVSYINDGTDGLTDSSGTKIDLTNGSAVLDIGETYTLAYSSVKENFDVSITIEGATINSFSYNPETGKGSINFTVTGDLKIIVSEKEKEKEYSKLTLSTSVDNGLSYLDYSLTSGEGDSLKEIVSGEDIEVGTLLTLKASVKEENSEFVSITGVKIGDKVLEATSENTYTFEMPESDSTLTIEMKVLGRITVDKGNETLSGGAISITNKDGKEITYADAGEEVTITIKHKKSVEKVTVNGISATLVEEGVYTFNMPTGDANVVIEWSNEVKVKLEGGLTDVGIDFRNVDENGLTLSTVNIDWTTYTAELEIGQRYALKLSPYSGYQVDSVLINGIPIEVDTSNNTYYFVCDSETSVLTINTSEIVVADVYNITFDPQDTGIDTSTVKFSNITNDSLTNQGEEGDTIWVFFYDVYNAPKNVYFNGEKATDMSSGMGTTWQFIMPAEDVVITCDFGQDEPAVSENTLTIANNTGEEIINSEAGDGLFLGTGAMMTPVSLSNYVAELEANKEYTLYYSSSLGTIEVTATSNINISQNYYGAGVGSMTFTYTEGPAQIIFEPGMAENEFRLINCTGTSIVDVNIGDGLFPSSAMGASVLTINEDTLNGSCTLTPGEMYYFYFTINDLGGKEVGITVEGDGVDVTNKSYSGYGTVQFTYTSGPVKIIIELI